MRKATYQQKENVQTVFPQKNPQRICIRFQQDFKSHTMTIDHE